MDYAYSQGVPGNERTPVVSFVHNGELQFIKFARNRTSTDLMKNELRMNRVWRMKKMDSAVFPVVQKFSDKAIISLHNSKIDNRKEWTKFHAKFLLELSERTVYQKSFASSGFKVNVEENIRIIKAHAQNLNSSKYFIEALVELKDRLRCSELLFTHSHGDFTSWNSGVVNNKLYLIDLEHASFGRPMLHDYFHFQMQNKALVERQTWSQIKDDILEQDEAGIIGKFIDKWKIDPKLYLMAYVLNYVSFQIAAFSMRQKLTTDQEVLLSVWTDLFQDWNLGLESVDRSRLIYDLTSVLKKHEHVYLKQQTHPYQLPVNSDLDILLAKDSITSVTKFIESYPGIYELKKVKKSFMTSFRIELLNKDVLHLDLIHDFVQKGRRYLNASQVLKSRIYLNGYPRPSLKCEIENLMLFYGLNDAQIPDKYQQEINDRIKWRKPAILNYLNSKYGLSLASVSEAFDLKTCAKKQIKSIHLSNAFRRGVGKIEYLADVVTQVMKNPGFVCTLSGVDGVGKTTLINSLQHRLHVKFRKEVVLLRHRPGILPILSSLRYGKKKAEYLATTNLPRQGGNKNKISSLLRFGYYFMDYLIGQFYVQIKYTWRGKIVLYDRYYFDFINDPERSNIKLKKSFVKGLYNLLFKPKVNFFLYASASTIRVRKQELSVKDITYLTSGYKALFEEFSHRYQGKYIMIENQEKEKTIQRILKELSAVA